MNEYMYTMSTYEYFAWMAAGAFIAYKVIKFLENISKKAA